jgi:CRP/FNR family transcriptional regulator
MTNQTSMDLNDIFKALDPDSQSSLMRVSVEKQYKKGQMVFDEGAQANTLYYIKAGWVKMGSHDDQGATSIHQVHNQGQFFCLPTVLMRAQTRCQAVAGSDVTMLLIPATELLAVVDRLPPIARTLLHKMAPAVREAHKACDYCYTPVASRVASALLRLHEQFKGGELPVTRQELAQMAGTTPESTIRVMSVLQKKGVVAGDRGHLRILDLQALKSPCTMGGPGQA